MRRHLLLAPLAVVALAASGCGSSDSGSTSSAPATPSTSTPAAASSSSSTVAVGMEGIQFVPKEITVKVGQTVKWTDLEDIPHNVKADSGADFSSKTFGKDGTFSYKTTKAGTIEYQCTLHPGMVGTVTVEG